MIRWLITASLALSLIVGCKNDEACERARLDLSKAWGELREAAARRKLAGVDVEGWAFVEDRTSLLESSFMTSQVTWSSADKARTELAARLPSLSTDAPAHLVGYRTSVDAALKQQEAFSAQCR
jgi:hypothetical protein